MTKEELSYRSSVDFVSRQIDKAQYIIHNKSCYKKVELYPSQKNGWNFAVKFS